jgi:hypothetical protein
MASLWWQSQRRDVSGALAGVGELRFLIFNELQGQGFTGVVTNDLEVAGGKDGCWVSIAHFPIADRAFWEVVMVSGDTVEATRSIADSVAATLRNMHFL